MKKILWITGFVIILATLGYADYYAWKLVKAGTGIVAKMLGSGVFVSKRDPTSIINEDIHQTVNFIHLEVDHVAKVVTSTAFGLIQRRAIYREGLGCTLLTESDAELDMLPLTVDLTPKPKNQKTLPWPTGDMLSGKPPPSGVNTEKLADALDWAFSEPYPERPRRTRAVVILYDGRIIAERYADGFTRDMPLLGYGMTKGVINALVGILVGQGKLSLDEPAPVPEWDFPGDPRGAITLDHLLRMSSGLEFNDSRPPLTDSVLMFGKADMAAFAADKPLEAEPGTRWSHSNGTTNIIARIIRHTFGGNDAEYYAFPRRALFDRIGMRSAVIELDASGTFVGSTYMYAPLRDWARLGLLYLRDGVWEGERILPEGWVAYTTTPAPSHPIGGYGAHFWLKPGTSSGDTGESWPNIPGDAYLLTGHDGQSLTVIPSRQLVVVRLGLTQDQDAWNLDTFITRILAALEG